MREMRRRPARRSERTALSSMRVAIRNSRTAFHGLSEWKMLRHIVKLLPFWSKFEEIDI